MNDNPLLQKTLLPYLLLLLSGLAYYFLAYQTKREDFLQVISLFTFLFTLYFVAYHFFSSTHFKYLLIAGHEIYGWQEMFPDSFGANKKMLTTKAIRKKTIWLDYWKHNSIADTTYRDTLQLKQHE
jgi:predicted membrane protein